MVSLFVPLLLLATLFLQWTNLSLAAPQQSVNVTALIIERGYPVEVHVVVSPDGYELIVHRIPHGLTNAPKKGVVLLQHGLTDSSAGYCLNDPTEGLAYILADYGYDVWLGNNRGNGYSMNNVNFGPDDTRFWDFSWDEMALYDFPTFINYVVNSTSSTKISYIGHSEGTIQAFAGLISNPDIADKLNVYIALAPVAFVGGITVPLFTTLSALDADELLLLLGIREFYLPAIIHSLLPDVCIIDPSVCEYGGSAFYGPNTYLNESRLEFYTIYEPFPTSAKNIIHWAQGVRTKTFQKYDYGTQGNIQHYGQSTPPPYLISKFPSQLPVVFITGGIDGLADPADVEILQTSLPSTPTVYYRADYGHIDPLLGYTAHTLVYPHILAELDKHQYTHRIL
eukprot:TRINITY_DN2477_c1_g1_i1.p1 TRINITY_DN2477_c1_g1~~TRINITY_DN2477_c1_g1_i1.p1  ORF type:complete len:396 (+),score=65.96 TRINITY_DN2477_c1_g1_i1:79-1266(+)